MYLFIQEIVKLPGNRNPNVRGHSYRNLNKTKTEMSTEVSRKRILMITKECTFHILKSLARANVPMPTLFYLGKNPWFD